MKKRVLSLILAIAMLVTLLPTVAFAEGEAAPTQVFDFTQYNPTNELVPMLGFKYDEHGWEVDQTGTSEYLKTSFWNEKGIYAPGIYGYIRLEYLQYRPYTLDLNIEKDGYYSVSVQLGLKHANNGYGSVYVDGKYMGQLCNVNRNDVQTLRPIELKAGKHKFTVIADKAGTTANQAYINISNITFAGIEAAPALSEAKLSLTGTEGYVGDSIDASASLKFNNGTTITALTESYLDDLSDDNYDYNKYKTAAGESITLTSSDSSVAKVDGTKISLRKAGSADITFSATLDGVTKSVTKTVTVSEPNVPAEEGYTLTYNLTSGALSSRVPTVTGSTAVSEALAGDCLRDGKIAYQLGMFGWKYTTSRVAEGDTGEVPYATLDLTKTDPYAIEHNAHRFVGVLGTNGYVDNTGMTALILPGKYANASSDRPHVALRLKVDKTGTYDVTFASPKIEDYAPFVEVYFGKAPASYAPADIDTVIASDAFESVGWWSSKEGYFASDVTATTKEDKKLSNLTVEVPETGEYWFILNTSAKSSELNPTNWVSGSNVGQYLRVNEVKLVAKASVIPERPENYSLSYNTTLGAMSSRITRENSNDAFNGISDSIWTKPDGTSPVLYNLDLMNWKKTLTDGDGEYKALDTSKTAEFAIESCGYQTSGQSWIVGDGSTQVNATSLDITPASNNYSVDSSSRPHLALRLNIPYAGVYKLAFIDNSAANASKPYAKIMFGQAPDSYSASAIDELLANYTHLGWWSSTDGHFSSDLTVNTKADCKVNYLTVNVPSAGEYYLVFDFPAMSKELNSSTLNGNHQYFRLSGFTLTGIEAAAPEKIESDIPSKITVEDSATVTAKIKMDDGSYAKFSAEDTVTVTGDNFATVSETAANGEEITFKVTGANAGDAVITVAGKVGGKDFSYTLETTIKGAELPRPDNFSVTYDLTINALSSKVPTITDNSSTGEGLYNGSVLYNWTYLDWKRVAKDESGADYNPLDTSKTGAYKLEIVNNKFPAGVTNGNTTAQDTAFVMPLASYTNTSATRPHVAIRLVVPYAGMYEVMIADGQSTTYEPYVKVYFGEAPKTYDAASVDNLVKNYEFLGWWSGQDGHFAPELTEDTVEASKLDKFVVNVPSSGEYFIIFDTDALSKTLHSGTLSNAGVNHYFRVGSIGLKGIAAASAQSVETDAKEVVALDKEYTFTAKIKMNDRTYANFDGDCVISVNGSENVTVSDVSTSGETITYKVKGTAVSEAEKITFSGQIGGNAFSFEKGIIVAANEIVNKSYEFNKYITSGVKPIVTEYTYDKDGWEINKNGTCTYLVDTFWKGTAGLYPLGIYAYLRPTPLTYRTMALDFAIDQDGFYDVSILTTALNATDGGWASVYIDGKYIGQINGVQGKAGDTKLRPLELKAGKHTLFVAGDVALSGTHARMAIGNLKFTGTPAKSNLSDVTLTLPTGKVFAGTDITAETTLKFDNGVETVGITESYVDDLVLSSYNYNGFKTAEGESMVITSSDEEIAKVEGKTIKLLSDGEVDLTFTATLDGVTKSVTKTLEVQKAILSEVVLKAETGYILLADADGIAINVTGKLSDGNAADLTNAEIIMESSDPTVAAVENGRIIPKSLGDVTITVTVILDDEEISKEINLIVSEVPIAPSFEIMFKDKTSQATSKGGYFTADTHGDTWTINTELTNTNYYNGNTSSAVRIQDSVQYGYLYNHGDFVFNFETDMDGNYDIELEMIPDTSTSGIVKFYIDDMFVGSMDARADVRDLYTPTVKLGRPIALSEGTHTLTVRKPGNAFVNGVRFIGTAQPTAFEGIEIGVPRNEFAAGESEEYSMKLIWANGAALDVPITNLNGSLDAEFEVTSSDESIVSVSGTTFKALKTGVANLQTEAEFAGSQISGTTQITVNDATYDHAELNLDEDTIYFEGGTKTLETSVILSNGKKTDARNVSNVRYESSNESVAKVENGVLKNIAEGEVTITAYATFNSQEKSVSKTIEIERVKLVSISASTEDNIISALDADGSKIVVTGHNNDGSSSKIDGEFTFEALTPEIFTVTGDGHAVYASRGVGKVKVTAKVGDQTFECVSELTSSSQKTEPTIYTYEMREMALENVKKYDWAKTLQKSAVSNSEKYLENLEKYYDLIPAEGIPRSYTITTLQSPDSMTYICPYCRGDIRALHGAYSWIIDPIKEPWKIQCPDCKRLFPSNDFESFYKLGLKPDGTFDRELAYQKNQELVDAGQPGYLVNELYPEVATVEKLNVAPEDVDTWMVDDGFGWSPKDGTYGSGESTKTNPKWAPIAYYTHWFWDANGSKNSIISRAINDLRDAYLYTGDEKYGRAGAILLDRIADVYDDYDVTKISLSYSHSHGGDYSGKTVGSIWETNVANAMVRGYDAFYPMMDDPQVIEFLSKKAAEYGSENPKTSGDMIRENAENGILRSVIDGVKTAKINGNFGMHQLSMALAAVALDTYPETNDAFEWMALPGGETKATVTDPIYGDKYSSSIKNAGGEMLTRYINDVDRDGFGNEVGIGYNMLWVNNGLEIAELLYRYGAETDINLFENPKYLKMFNSFIKENVGPGYGLSIGDSGGTATTAKTSIENHTLRAFNMLNDPQLAKNYYWAVDGELKDIYIDIFSDNASLEKRIQDAIDEYGEYEFESENLTGFGLGILRHGEYLPGSNGGSDYRGDAWMFYGRTVTSHAHKDMLQLGIDAYGFNFTPDLGYPEATGYDANRLQWCAQSISHNVVTVNGESQLGLTLGNPLHFDDAGNVKVMDVEANGAYKDTDIYRRTAVSVAASNQISYTVDFFRVKGGDEHTYSFHTQSLNGYTTDDLTLVPQKDENGDYVGTYAGADVPYGPDPNTLLTSGSYTTEYTRGYTWLTNVNRAENIADGTFSVNFKQTDFRKQTRNASGLNLKFTALNDWTPSGIGFATGYAPRVASNKVVPGLDYMLIHRTGKKLDTLFTSVIQPYNGEEYIDTMESVAVEVKDGKANKDDVVKAIKVTLKNGRRDYIVYSTNNTVTYTVDGKFDFRGFVGVYSESEAGENIYAYVNDGDIIGETTGVAALTGKIVSHTDTLSSQNYITVKLDNAPAELDLDSLTKKYIYVDNVHSDQNGAYRILGASKDGENIILDIGDVSLVRKFANNSNPDAGYVFNVKVNNSFTIPMSTTLNEAPEIAPVGEDITTSAGSSITINVKAESVLEGKAVKYEGRTLPRGATIDAETGAVTWKPTSSQIGENGFVVAVIDEDGRESTVTFTVTVYGSTTGGSSGAGGGGGAGGSGSGTSGEDNTTQIPDSSASEDGKDNASDSSANTGDGETSGQGNGAPSTGTDTSTVRFIDLGSHIWAADSINALADDGIVKGTTPNTYSPAANITRADFALLLVRAFKLTSENTENFDDVLPTDYFADELAIARNTGIVNGIGDNKYAPRNTITRQDMMTIVYRALTSLEKITVGEDDIITPDYPDFDSVADYAKDAVKALITSGIVNGKSGKIAPADYTTRAEVAVLLKRILDYTAE